MSRSCDTVTRIIGIEDRDMISDQDIRNQIASYLLSEIDLDQFEDWFVQNTWNVQKWGDPYLQDLVFAVESELSEYSGSNLSEASLRNRLMPMVQIYQVIYGDTPIVTSTSTAISQTAPVDLGQPFGIGLSMVSS